MDDIDHARIKKKEMKERERETGRWNCVSTAELVNFFFIFSSAQLSSAQLTNLFLQNILHTAMATFGSAPLEEPLDNRYSIELITRPEV